MTTNNLRTTPPTEPAHSRGFGFELSVLRLPPNWVRIAGGNGSPGLGSNCSLRRCPEFGFEFRLLHPQLGSYENTMRDRAESIICNRCRTLLMWGGMVSCGNSHSWVRHFHRRG